MRLSIRRVVLIRHGQYEERGDGVLTALGREQAAVTRDALRGMGADSIVSSTLSRAMETGAIVAAAFPQLTLKHDDLLCECTPTALPASLRVVIHPAQIKADRARAEKAYARIFRPSRAPTTDVVVCHGNIIRFFACKALGVAPRVWINMASLHCGLTEISVLPNGETRLMSYNDTGHLPRALRTMSNAAAKRD